MVRRSALPPQRKPFFRGLQIDPLWDKQQVMGVACAKRPVDSDVSGPIGRGHSMIEQNTEHAVAEPGEPIVDRRAIAFGLVAGFGHKDRAMPAEKVGCAVEYAALVALGVDLDQVERGDVVLGRK